MPVRTSGWLSDTSIEDLFQYAIDNNADVISCSWKASGAYFPLSTRMNGIIHKAATQGRQNGKGCVILFAAGNESAPLNDRLNNVNYHQGFALHPDVIAVAASNSLDEQSNYSNYGPELTICAPSSGSPGKGIVTTDRRGGHGYSSGDYTFSFGGTSSSTPLCAGLAGLILSVDPDLTSAEVRNIIMNTADKIDPSGGQYNTNGHSPIYGHGRINAEAAVVMASGSDPGNGLPQTLLMEHRVKTPIPDLGEITDTIPFPIQGNIIEMEISVDIKHTWRGDLSIYLEPPGHNEITLVNRTGGAADNIIQTFRSSDDPDLFQNLINSQAHGNWTLRITDNAQRDDGILNKWGIAITY
jgi:subtilisin-like proprotein convertase family protein